MTPSTLAGVKGMADDPLRNLGNLDMEGRVALLKELGLYRSTEELRKEAETVMAKWIWADWKGGKAA